MYDINGLLSIMNKYRIRDINNIKLDEYVIVITRSYPETQINAELVKIINPDKTIITNKRKIYFDKNNIYECTNKSIEDYQDWYKGRKMITEIYNGMLDMKLLNIIELHTHMNILKGENHND